MSEKIKLPKDTIPPQSFQRNIEFVVDTIPNNSDLGGYYSHKDNSLTITHMNGKTNTEIILHEHRHKDNFNSGIYSYAMSFEQIYKLNMHDEISANMADLIGLRDKYLKTGDITVFDNYLDSDKRYDFYKQAILNGEIKPGSKYKEDFDKEMSLIINGTMKMWMEDFAETEFYFKQNAKTANLYAERNPDNEKYYDQNYALAVKKVYTMGGVDFSKYLNEDVKLPKEVREAFIAKKIIEDTAKTADLVSELPTKPVKSSDSIYEIVHGELKYGSDKATYRKWQNKDGFRFSEPQTTTILDLSKNCIAQPTLSYANEKLSKYKANAQASEDKLKNAIKRRKGNEKAIVHEQNNDNKLHTPNKSVSSLGKSQSILRKAMGNCFVRD